MVVIVTAVAIARITVVIRDHSVHTSSSLKIYSSLALEARVKLYRNVQPTIEIVDERKCAPAGQEC